MFRQFVRWHTLIGCVALTAAIGMVTFLRAGPAPETEPKPVSPVEKIRKALDTPITLEITDQSIEVALNQLRDQTKINFVVDRFSIQQMGLDPSQMQVNVKLKDVKARSGLRSILTPYNLGYAIIGDTILVSTDDMAMHRQMRQRVTIDLEKVEFAAALKQIAKDSGTSIILDSRVAKDAQTKVTMQLDDVPLENAVRLLSEMAGLKPVKVGNVLFVTSKANAVAMRNDQDGGAIEVSPPDYLPYKDKAK